MALSETRKRNLDNKYEGYDYSAWSIYTDITPILPLEVDEE